MATPIDEIIIDPRTYASPIAHDAIFSELRRSDPVRWTEPEGYRPFWTISKYADICEIERQSEKFINWPRAILSPIVDEEKVRAGTGRGSTNALRMLVNMDSPDHRLYRTVAQSWFAPPNLRKLEHQLKLLAAEFVNKMQDCGNACDFVKDVAVWYPLRTIMTILGVPREHDRKMLSLTQAIFGCDDPEIAGEFTGVDARQAATKEFFRYFGELSEERRRHPTDDLATVIATAQISGEPMPGYEAMSYYFIIATAGHDTTSSTLAGGLLALLQNPEQFEKLRQRPELLPKAIDEMLRWVTPVKHFFRTATEDYELRGKTVKSGDSLMMCYPSANRDEEIFSDPFTFDIERTPNRHIAFGYGPHLCLGMHLAKMELKAVFEELLSRIDTLVLSGEPDWVRANFVSGLKTLPVSYTFKKRAA